MDIVGLNPRIDIDGFIVSIDGIDYPTLDSSKGSAISFRRDDGRYDTFINVHPDLVRLRDVDIRITGTLGTGTNDPKVSAINLQNGCWELDWENAKSP